MRNTLESIINQNQVLAEVMKSVDSACPDPFNEPEKFSVYFAQKSISLNSLSDEFDDETATPKSSESSSETENALLRLQNLRMEEQRGFQIERENFETRLGQLSLLQQEIELLRKQNSEHEIQIKFLKSQTQSDSEVDTLKAELLAVNEKHFSEISKAKAEIEALISQNDSRHTELAQLNETIERLTKELADAKENRVIVENLMKENVQLKGQLQLNSEGQERQFREISEENARLKIEFHELERELAETRTQLNDLEVIRQNI